MPSDPVQAAEEENVQRKKPAPERGFLVYAVVHGDGVRIHTFEQFARLFCQVEITASATEIEYAVFSHFAYRSFIFE